ncbi:hypothetical protein CAPN010_16010 [Capnocytophaga cynodegmi]|uniref:hypothetical protein n=1 Tax=Capnocytophaga cynodegmi TaxID=28189 RepID=UPI001EE1E71E|nr:hypothetical protein [Capnocytophaga cynodegmi]GJQ07443.1 hypothetical protein CAPN010_16010 [Capnocytophaga cynodegmi]
MNTTQYLHIITPKYKNLIFVFFFLLCLQQFYGQEWKGKVYTKGYSNGFSEYIASTTFNFEETFREHPNNTIDRFYFNKISGSWNWAYKSDLEVDYSIQPNKEGLHIFTVSADDGFECLLGGLSVYKKWTWKEGKGKTYLVVLDLNKNSNITLKYNNLTGAGNDGTGLYLRVDNFKLLRPIISDISNSCSDSQLTISATHTDIPDSENPPQNIKYTWHIRKIEGGHQIIENNTYQDLLFHTTNFQKQSGTYEVHLELSFTWEGKIYKTTSLAKRFIQHPSPNVSIRPSSKRLCQGGSAEIKVVVNSGSGGTPPFTLSYKLNGVALQVKSNENTFNIPINSNQTGTFKYEYESITDGKGCTTSIHKTDNITINPLPTATFLEQNTTLCSNTPEQRIPWVTFTGKPPFTVRVKATKTGETPKEKEFPLENNQNSLVIEHNPNDKGEFTYEILWVRDANGCTTYFTDKKKVINVVAPSIAPFQDVAWCLPEIVSAVYDNNGNTIITENSYVLPLGDTALDVVVNSVPCCPNPTLKWTINNDLSNTRTGQPSTLGNISFENATSSDKTYTITYWLECNGQKYNHITRQVRITPRPNLEFQ